MRGYVQVYTGDGKGKTTAAMGLALRAAGAGLHVYIAQFMKKGDYSEILALQRFEDLITLEQFGAGGFVKGKPSAEDVRVAEEGLVRVAEIMRAGNHQLVILDEINVATSLGLIPVDKILALCNSKPDGVEVVLTGRDAAPQIIARADLVSEINAVKHYFQNGVPARIGIEK